MHTGTQRELVLARFLIDPTASRFTVQAFATGMLSSFGHNPTIGMRDYDGEIQFVPETFEHALVRLTVRTSAMEVLDEMKNDDRKKLEKEMYENVLDVEHFPVVVYESKEIAVQNLGSDVFLARVTGELSFHGVTQRHSVEGRVTNMGSMLRISGEFPLRQSVYGMKAFSFAGGALRLKDELKFKFELVARKQE
jgi:polyisoprenoid-binding protein YceI